MGLPWGYDQAVDINARMQRISEHGFPWRLSLAALPSDQDSFTSGELAAEARQEYQSEKAERAAERRPGLGEMMV